MPYPCAFILLLEAALLASAPPANAQAVEKPPALKPAPAARAATAENASRQITDEFDCLLEPHMLVNVASPLDSVLDEVLVTRGDRVQRGQPLARLKSGLETATVKLRAAKAVFGKRKAERSDELFKKQLIAEGEKDELDTNALLAELELKESQEALALRTIRSPVNGVVVERFLNPGEQTRQEKIVRLAQIDPLNVEVILPAELYGAVRNGMTGDVRLEAPLRTTARARIVVVDRVIDGASGTFGVRLELPNAQLAVPAGLRCKVRFHK